jgi:hypothetical protein
LGASVFVNSCARCHGAKAEGTARGASLRGITTQAELLERWAAEHPALFAAMSEMERADLWAWLQSMR